jgi:hypothetical protein
MNLQDSTNSGTAPNFLGINLTKPLSNVGSSNFVDVTTFIALYLQLSTPVSKNADSIIKNPLLF